MIRFENVTKIHDPKARPALDSVSVEIEGGEFVFLVGASGSGKSTFLKMVYREDVATTGSVYVAGHNVSTLSSWRVPKLRRKIGVVFQDFRILPQKNVYQNVAFAMQVIGASRARTKERVSDVLAMVGLEGMEKRMQHELSGGEQQRVAIARAVANAPLVLLADEPTGNPDPVTASYVFEALGALVKQSGLAALIATHNHELASRMDRRVTLADGKVVPL